MRAETRRPRPAVPVPQADPPPRAVRDSRARSATIPGCTSCDVLLGNISPPGGVIFQDDHWHVDSVLAPVHWRGFLIAKLKRHCEHLADLTENEATSIGHVLCAACAAVADELSCPRVYVCSFGDGVKHVHFWILPRHQGTWPGRRWVMACLTARKFLAQFLGVRHWQCADNDVEALADRLRKRMRRSLTGNKATEGS